MNILAIDPGPEQSAYLLWDGKSIITSRIAGNGEILSMLWSIGADVIACEWIASYGMAVGASVFHTCRWVGRFEQATPMPRTFLLITRQEVKMHICHSMRAKDSNIRQALIDRFGEPGTKKTPGLLYGIKSHLWAALAVAITAMDQQQREPRVEVV